MGSGDGDNQKGQNVTSSESALPLALPILAYTEQLANTVCKSLLLCLLFPLGLSPLTSPYTWIPSSEK